MSEELGTRERQDLASEVGRLRSGVLAAAWTVETLNEGTNPPETESRRFELYEGVSFILVLLAERLAEVYRTVNMS